MSTAAISPLLDAALQNTGVGTVAPAASSSAASSTCYCPNPLDLRCYNPWDPGWCSAGANKSAPGANTPNAAQGNCPYDCGPGSLFSSWANFTACMNPASPCFYSGKNPVTGQQFNMSAPGNTFGFGSAQGAISYAAILALALILIAIGVWSLVKP